MGPGCRKKQRKTEDSYFGKFACSGRQPDLQNADILPAANRTNPKFTAAGGGPISTNIFRRGLNHQPDDDDDDYDYDYDYDGDGDGDGDDGDGDGDDGDGDGDCRDSVFPIFCQDYLFALTGRQVRSVWQ